MRGKSSENHLIVCGLNYHSSPISIRERITIPESCLEYALRALAQLPHITEAAVVSTCNRTEVYAIASDLHNGLREIENFFRSAQGVQDHGELKADFKLLRDDAALHLFRVASGLDSMVMGEGQILAQVKSAHQAAQKAGTVGTILNHLFDLAAKCGKRVRSETSIGRRAVSASSAAVELGRELLGDLQDKNVVVIGAGKMGQLCLKQLLSGCKQGTVSLLNRDNERSKSVAHNLRSDKLNCKEKFADRSRLCATADLVIVCTSADGFVLEKEQIEKARRGASKPLTIVDISVPRNVDPSMANLPGVKLFHSDHLAQIVKTNLAERQSLIGEAENIVFETLDEFTNWQQALDVVPTITQLRSKIETIRQEHVDKAMASSSGQSKCPFKQFEQMSQSLVNQILHHPTVQLKSPGINMQQKVELLSALFGLDSLGRR
ncbi:MAG TPA: glutamyl-tRNA reductase [Planktothrix sp.]|jgi:glutamyl-tRNA reductase